MFSETKILIVLAALFAVCVAYAIILDRHPHWYVPDGTLYTVIVGVGFITIAIFALELWGVAAPGTGWLVFFADCAAGFPIGVWQFIQRARNNGRRQARRYDE